MCSPQCVLALIALSVGLAHSWDFAVTTLDHLEFYTNGTKTHSEGFWSRDLAALAYDAVHNMLLFVDIQSESILSFDLTTKKYQPLVRAYQNINDLAFDPIKGLLFWTDTEERSIYYVSLKPRSKNHVNGTLLFKMKDEIPTAIAVDSCRGYIYWTNTNTTKPTIERARFNGSEREVVTDSNIYMPDSITLDQQTKKIYWVDYRDAAYYSIESADLNGNNRTKSLRKILDKPTSLTVSKDSIYWVVGGDGRRIFQISKNALGYENPKQITDSIYEIPFGIAANYKIEDQTRGIQECEALTNLSQNNSAINDFFNIPTDVDLICSHGIKVNAKSLCKCTPGYTGERCDISVCQNYCFQGNCSISDEGHPKCRCNTGYSGERCEVDVCFNYCLNNGVCLQNELYEPVCQCGENHEGLRCEGFKNVTCSTTPTHDSIKRNYILPILLSKRQKTRKFSIFVEL